MTRFGATSDSNRDFEAEKYSRVNLIEIESLTKSSSFVEILPYFNKKEGE